MKSTPSRFHVPVAPHREPPPLKRLHPPRARLLSVRDLNGAEWRPSGTPDGTSMFAVLWDTPFGLRRWAPLHDFDQQSRERLIADCARMDQEASIRAKAPR